MNQLILMNLGQRLPILPRAFSELDYSVFNPRSIHPHILAAMVFFSFFSVTMEPYLGYETAPFTHLVCLWTNNIPNTTVEDPPPL